MSTKLTENIAFRVDAETSKKLEALAAIDGLSSSELIRVLVDAHIQDKFNTLILLSRAFPDEVNIVNKV